MGKRIATQLTPPLLNQVLAKWGSGMAELRRHVLEIRLMPSRYFDVNKHIAKFTVMGHDRWEHSITRPMIV